MSQARKPSTIPRQQNVIVSRTNNNTLPQSDDTSNSVSTNSLYSTEKKTSEQHDTEKSKNPLAKMISFKVDDTLVVPMKSRRGLLSSLCLVPEFKDSRQMPPNLRRFMVFIIAFCAMLGPMGTSILLPASDDAVASLHTTITILNVAIGVYLITLGVIPLWWSNLSERHGRRSVYIVSFILYLGFTIGCALAPTINILIGFRVLSGGCAASVQSVGAGTIGDLYPITKRGAAMGLFYLGPLAGPLLSPIIGGGITSNPKFGWRATQWFLVCLSGGCCLLIIFFLPETLRKQDNREAIRQILRERRMHKILKDDDEQKKTADQKVDEGQTDEKKAGDNNNINNNVNTNTDNNTPNINKNILKPNYHLNIDHDTPHEPFIPYRLSESPLSETSSINSQAISDTDVNLVDEEEVEHLNRLITKMSTRKSFASVINKSESKSRKASFASQKRLSSTNQESGTNTVQPNTEINNQLTPQTSNLDDYNSSDTEKDFEHDDDSDFDNEGPIMDAVAPLSRIVTKTKHSFLADKSKQRASFADELETIHQIAHGSKYKLFLYYLKIYLYGPLKAFVFIKYPPVFLAMAYSGPCFAALYVQNMTLTYMYSRKPYNFPPVLIGLVYIPNSVTYFIASIWGGRFNDHLLKKKIEKYGVIAPEARFGINVYVAAAILPGSLLITGWCLEYGEHWVTPLIGTALFGFAQMIVIGVTVTYLADCLPGKGATGIALNNFIRMIMAAGVSFATEPLIEAIGTGVLFSICAGVTAVLSILIVIIIRYGDHWRETYDLEALYDYVDA